MTLIYYFLECPDNRYGTDCHPCSPNCKTPPCYKFSATGVCIGGCVTGYTGEACFECKPAYITVAIFLLIIVKN